MKRAFLAFGRAGMEAYFKVLTDKSYVIDKSRGWGVHFDLLRGTASPLGESQLQAERGEDAG